MKRSGQERRREEREEQERKCNALEQSRLAIRRSDAQSQAVYQRTIILNSICSFPLMCGYACCIRIRFTDQVCVQVSGRAVLGFSIGSDNCTGEILRLGVFPLPNEILYINFYVMCVFVLMFY